MALPILPINLKFKYFILSLQKNIMSYTEELFIYIIYVILFVILVLFSINSIKESLIKANTGSVAFYEKDVFVKSQFLQVIKKNYLLLRKKGSLKKYIKKLFKELKKSERKLKKKNKKKNK